MVEAKKSRIRSLRKKSSHPTILPLHHCYPPVYHQKSGQLYNLDLQASRRNIFSMSVAIY